MEGLACGFSRAYTCMNVEECRFGVTIYASNAIDDTAGLQESHEYLSLLVENYSFKGF